MSPLLPVLLSALLLSPPAAAHGLLTDPPQRGALRRAKFTATAPLSFPAAPSDPTPHFPAGDKSPTPGAAARSQLAESNRNWTPFQPLSPAFRWRAGVCGDQKRLPQHHMRGGRFYHAAQITRTYRQAQTVEFQINIVANHNGFVEFHICDVRKCAGEISEQCFRDGHCVQLQRAPNPACDSGTDTRCAPVDPAYPGRWYMPCATKPENSLETFGGPKMLYRLPERLVCEHCVLHWFWSAANTCNPPGVIDFFEGPHAPRWGDCFGQGGARGGYTKVQKPCGPDRNPEEYYQCADVAILPAEAVGNDDQNPETQRPEQASDSNPVSAADLDPTPVANPLSDVEDPTPSPPAASDETAPQPVDPSITPQPGQVFKEFSLVADGEVIGPLVNGMVVDIAKYDQVAIEAVTFEDVATNVKFYLDGVHVWTDYKRPYFMFGNKKRQPNYWTDPITNRFFDLVATADGSSLEASIIFTK